MTRPIRIAVLGAGSWGTTVASLAARKAETVIWARRADAAEQISREHRNHAYLTGLPLHPQLRATTDLEPFTKGRTTAEIVASMNMVAEGIKTSSVVMEIAGRLGIEMLIAAEVAAVVKGERGAVEAFRGLRRLVPGAEQGVA